MEGELYTTPIERERMRNETWYHYTKVHVCIVLPMFASQVVFLMFFLEIPFFMWKWTYTQSSRESVSKFGEVESENGTTIKTDDREHVKWLGVNSFGRYIYIALTNDVARCSHHSKIVKLWFSQWTKKGIKRKDERWRRTTK